jgi:hypothetical protein
VLLLDYCFSSVCNVVSGVPRGSVLGPILFLIYINDLDSVCCGNTVLQLFADDAKLYSNIDINSTFASLQQSLDKLTHWANDWQLTTNVSKCLVVSISVKYEPAQLNYYINGIPVPRQYSPVDLGVTICSNLSFEIHISNIVSKARQRLSILFRGFLTRNIYIIRQVFITYVRPILEYNSIVWNPGFTYLIDLLEGVQRNFTERQPSISAKIYLARLASLDLELLELKRLRADLVYYFKIFKNLTPHDPDKVSMIYTPIPSFKI